MAARCFCFCSSAVALKSHRLSISVPHNNIEKKQLHFCSISSSSTRSLPSPLRKCRTNFCTKANVPQRHGRNLSSKPRAAVADDDDGDAADSAATKGRQLWRSELQSASELSNEFESLDGATLERDIERFAKKEEIEKLWNYADGSKKDQAPDQRGGIIRDVVDKILVADFFFILFILTWLLVGLAERAALESTNLIDSWLPLWPSVFQPALGAFMAGAIVSAVTRKE